MNESEKKYQEIYEKYKQYENAAHERNQKKIRVGLKVNIFANDIFIVLDENILFYRLLGKEKNFAWPSNHPLSYPSLKVEL